MTLHWHTDLDTAKLEATQTHRPILSLRLLGRLDERLSCANSRFFKTTLYPNTRVASVLGQSFVLHWRSMRPVPKITIDFGDGRTIERTITGNSAHLVLDAQGRPVDALPGLYGPDAFVAALGRSADLARSCASLPPRQRTERLRGHHRDALVDLGRRWSKIARGPIDATSDSEWSTLAKRSARDLGIESEVRANIERSFPSAAKAGRIAMSKARIEAPLLNAMTKLELSIAEDTLRNEYQLHRRVHRRFAEGAVEEDDTAFADWIYAELFLMPKEDPWLGLAPDDAYAALS